MVVVIVLCAVVIAGALQLLWASYEELNRALDQVADAHTSASMHAAMQRLQDAVWVAAGAMMALLSITIVAVIVVNRSLPRPVPRIQASGEAADGTLDINQEKHRAQVVDIRAPRNE